MESFAGNILVVDDGADRCVVAAELLTLRD